MCLIPGAGAIAQEPWLVVINGTHQLYSLVMVAIGNGWTAAAYTDGNNLRISLVEANGEIHHGDSCYIDNMYSPRSITVLPQGFLVVTVSINGWGSSGQLYWEVFNLSGRWQRQLVISQSERMSTNLTAITTVQVLGDTALVPVDDFFELKIQRVNLNTWEVLDGPHGASIAPRQLWGMYGGGAAVDGNNHCWVLSDCNSLVTIGVDGATLRTWQGIYSDFNSSPTICGNSYYVLGVIGDGWYNHMALQRHLFNGATAVAETLENNRVFNLWGHQLLTVENSVYLGYRNISCGVAEDLFCVRNHSFDQGLSPEIKLRNVGCYSQTALRLAFIEELGLIAVLSEKDDLNDQNQDIYLQSVTSNGQLGSPFGTWIGQLNFEGTLNLTTDGVIGWTDIDGNVRIQSLGYIPDAINRPGQTPINFQLLEVFPNPFNVTATIVYRLAKAATTSIVVYDLTGRRVMKLLSSWQVAGEHRLTWSGRDLPSGLYLLRLQTPYHSMTQKVVLLK